MTTDAFQLLGGVLASVWQLFTGWYLPGTRATVGEVALLLLAAYVTLKFFRRIGNVDSDDK